MPVPRRVPQPTLLIIIDKKQRRIALANGDQQWPNDSEEKRYACKDMQEVQDGYRIQKAMSAGRPGKQLPRQELIPGDALQYKK